MKNLNLLFVFLFVLSFCSCSSNDDDPSEMAPDYIGTYTLTSIKSNVNLDPDVTGTFSETEILDNLDCTSILILKPANLFSWEYVNLSQIINNIYTINYMELECIIFSGSDGEYELNGNTITFAFDASLSNINADVNDNTITVTLNEQLAVENGGEVEAGNVQLTLTYEK